MRILAALLLAIPVPAGAESYASLAVGASVTPSLFDHARFAFPDLAQGGPGCCRMSVAEDTGASSLRAAVGSYGERFGVEGSIAWLGESRAAFEVSGPFGGSVQGPGPGRCVESGRFRTVSGALEGTWRIPVLAGAVTPHAGLALSWTAVSTVSRCDLRTAVEVRQDYTRFSLGPIGGVRASWPVSRDYSVFANAEARRVTLSGNAEAARYDAGRPIIGSLWLGIERRFK